MQRTLRILAVLVFSLAVLSGVAVPNAVAAATRPAAIEQPAPFNPNPFRAMFRFLKHLIGFQPSDGGQIAPPHPAA